MKILLVSNYAWTVFNFRRGLISALRAAGYDVYVQTQFDGYQERLGVDRSHVLPLSIDRKGVDPLQDLRTIKSIYRAIQTVDADVCLLFTIKPAVYGGVAATLLRKPYVVNITGLGAAFLGRAWLRWVAKQLFRAGLARADRVFFQNADDRAFFVEHRIVRSDRTRVLPGSGVDLFRFRPTPYPENKSAVFLLVARLIWDKGVGEFVSAARRIRQKYPAVRFQLLGPTGVLNPAAISADHVAEWAREELIEYLGETDDVVPFIAAADCIVLPSSYREGVPRTLLEGAAMARPVVTTDSSGCRDAVDDGVTGLLCKVKDVSDLTDKLEQMLTMPVQARAEMGRMGRAKMEREFDEQLVFQHYLTALGDILKPRV